MSALPLGMIRCCKKYEDKNVRIKDFIWSLNQNTRLNFSDERSNIIESFERLRLDSRTFRRAIIRFQNV